MPPITIAVAAFENDSDANDDGEGDAAQGVFQSLNELNQKLFGRGKALSEGSTSGFRMIKTEFMPKPRVQGGADPGFMQEHENARQWMAEKGVDILIWGKVNAKNRVPTLFLSGSRWQGGSAHFPMSHALTLNPDVSKELWAVLHLAIAAEASEFPSEERVDLFTHLAATNSMASMIQEVGGILESAPLATSLGRANLGQAYWILGRAQRRLAMWLDNKGMLENAIESLRRAENQLGKDAFLMEWSFLQLDRGLLQLESGERLSDETRLKFSGMLFSVGLLSVTRELFPMDWAMAQSRMGDAHRLVGEILGEGSFALAYLEEAVVNYKNALQEYTREKAPLAFASAQSGMGMALTRLGELKQESIYLVQGVQAFKQALLVYTRRVTPSEWASNLNNLGIALTRLGEREGGTGHLEEAVEVYRQALLEYTRERAPEAWALTQSNLGAALTSLGEREGGTKRLEQAVEAYEQALLERSEERMPLQWATTMNNLGTAWRTLGVRGKDRIFLCKALGAHLQAWKMASQMGASHYMKVWGGNAEEDFALLEAVGVSDAGPGCGPVVSGEWLSVFPRGSYRK